VAVYAMKLSLIVSGMPDLIRQYNLVVVVISLGNNTIVNDTKVNKTQEIVYTQFVEPKIDQISKYGIVKISFNEIMMFNDSIRNINST
jgi:hypothetical protein